MLALFILVPLFLIIFLNLPFLRKIRRFSSHIVIAYAAIQLGFVLYGYSSPGSVFADSTAAYFNFNLSADALSRVMLLLIPLVALSAVITGMDSLREKNIDFRFNNLILISMTGMNGIVLLNDLFSLYVFLDVTIISSFIMIAMERKHEGLEGSFKYLVISAISTITILTSVAILMMVAGDTSFTAVRAALKSGPDSFLARLSVGLFMCGIFIKSGLVPFHWWLPDAYASASAPASVFLAGIVTKVTGVYSMIRVVSSVFGFTEPLSDIIMLAGCISIVAGALLALGQSDMKRMLAYSSISQVGYIILGFGSGTALGISGAVFHIFNHAVFKAQLFVNSAAVEDSLGSSDMNGMGGIASKMPVTGVTSLIAFMSAAGIPPLAGFWSKLLIIIALWQAGQYAYSAIAVLAGVITIAYFLSMQRKVFFGKLGENLGSLAEADLGYTFPAVLLASITIIMGLLFPFVFDDFIIPIGVMLLK
jgi:proton-translocating NADH-quinone oxidoreductase chain N